MTISLIDRFVTDEQVVPPQANHPFTYAYFAFLQYFHDLPFIEAHHVIISAHFTYGWMPTMLKLRNTNFEQAAIILTQVKQQHDITDSDLSFLIQLVNNSLVGVSKLLHFVDPERYAIWDSRVADYLNPQLSYAQRHHPTVYRQYLQACFEIINHTAFPTIHQSINTKIGRPVSALRAVEIVMYTKGGPTTELP
jgi:hypothetical protein